VLEREIAGFGASGRNGGWCSALFPASLSVVARRSSAQAAVALTRALQATVDEVGAAAATEGIDAHVAKGGTIALARDEVQLGHARKEVAEARRFGLGESDVRLLGGADARGILDVRDALGGVHTPHYAAIHPARLGRRPSPVSVRVSRRPAAAGCVLRS